MSTAETPTTRTPTAQAPTAQVPTAQAPAAQTPAAQAPTAQTTAAPKLRWVRETFSLPYYFGEIHLGGAKLDALVLDTHFKQLGSDAAHQPPEELRRQRAEMAMLYTCPVQAPLPRIAYIGGMVRYVPNHHPNYYVDLCGSFDDYFKSHVSRNERSNVRRKVRKLEKASGGLDARLYQTPEEFDEFYRIARELSQRTYQEKLLDAGLPDRNAEGLFKRQWVQSSAAGTLRAFLLYFQGQPIAFLWCPILDGVMYYELCGYDPQFAKYSPGTVLTLHALQHAFDDPAAQLFDFTSGEGDHKRKYASHCQLCAEVYYFPPSPKNLAVFGAHLGLRQLSGSVSALLDRLALKEKVRKLLRSL